MGQKIPAYPRKRGELFGIVLTILHNYEVDGRFDVLQRNQDTLPLLYKSRPSLAKILLLSSLAKTTDSYSHDNVSTDVAS